MRAQLNWCKQSQIDNWNNSKILFVTGHSQLGIRPSP